MTDISKIKEHTSNGEKLPAFAFVNFGDGAKVKVLSSKLLDVTVDGKTSTKFLVEGEVIACVNGIKVMNGKLLAGLESFPVGEKIALWLGGQAMDAVVTACLDVNATSVEDGALLTVEYVEDKDTGKQQPMKVYAAKYEAPARATSVSSLSGAAPAAWSAAQRSIL